MLPFSRIRREEEIFSASRYSVSNSSVVGKTLKSTAFRIYTETIITITDSMMSTTIRKSSSIDGMGMMSATTIATTAIGTAISPNPRDVPGSVRSLGLSVAAAAAVEVACAIYLFTDSGRARYVLLTFQLVKQRGALKAQRLRGFGLVAAVTPQRLLQQKFFHLAHQILERQFVGGQIQREIVSAGRGRAQIPRRGFRCISISPR